jgi:hypothetical protein
MFANVIAGLPSNFTISKPVAITQTISRSAGFVSAAILVCKFVDVLKKSMTS